MDSKIEWVKKVIRNLKSNFKDAGPLNNSNLKFLQHMCQVVGGESPGDILLKWDRP